MRSFFITSFSSFYFLNKANGSPLPLTRLDFKGRLASNDGDLNWKTTDEFNLQSFDLERSTDGRFYTTVTNVIAVNQPGVHQYNYTDKNITLLGAPVVYYRLKQKDINGHVVYSDIVALIIKNGHVMLLYPNPATNAINLSVSIDKAEQVNVRFTDYLGRVVKQASWKLSAGSNSLNMDISDLASGVYYLELKGETMNEHNRFIKK